MPKPQPIWERWKKDPEKAEKLYLAYLAIVVIANLLIFLGAAMFVILLLRK